MKTTLTVELTPTGKVSRGDKEVFEGTVETPEGKAFVKFYRSAPAQSAQGAESKPVAPKPPVVRKPGLHTADAKVKGTDPSIKNPLAGLDPTELAAVIAQLRAAGL